MKLFKKRRKPVKVHIVFRLVDENQFKTIFDYLEEAAKLHPEFEIKAKLLDS